MTTNNCYYLGATLALAFFARYVAGQVAGTAFAAPPVQSPLPPCPGSSILSWTACVGTYTLPDGTKYVSEWKDGKPIGEGTLTFPDGGKYIGESKDGKLFNGRCTQMMPNGTKYIGECKDGAREGQGTLMMPNGTKYVGEWKDDMRNGQGTEYGADGAILRSGIWQDGIFIRSG
jgi:hypothetical protein